MRNGRVQQNNYASSTRNTQDNERLFVVQHVMSLILQRMYLLWRYVMVCGFGCFESYDQPW